jgi:NADH-quinone oxidoreductase subunit L
VFAGLAKGIFSSTVLPFPNPGRGLEAGHAAGHAWVPYVASAVALSGIGLAFWIYVLRRVEPGETSSSGMWYRLVSRKFYCDEAWAFLARRVAFNGLAQPLDVLERRAVNGAYDAVATLTRVVSWLAAGMQNGKLQFYSGVGFLGLCLLYLLGKVSA